MKASTLKVTVLVKTKMLLTKMIILATLQKPRVNNPLRLIFGKLNTTSIKNKFDALCSSFK